MNHRIRIAVWLMVLTYACVSVGYARSRLVLPDGLEEIRAEAFADVNAEEILLPDSLEYIAPDAFSGIDCPVAIIDPGSYAHLWCIERDYPCRAVIAVGDRMDPGFEYGGEAFSACESTDPAVADVDENGRIEGMSVGNTRVKMMNGNGAMVELPLEVVDYAQAHRALCVAHRGASGYYRENTIKAFEYAHELGADVAELDVHRSRDGVIFVFHDRTIRVGDSKKWVADMTYKQLRKADKRICTLAEAVECIERTDMTIMVEFKATGITEEVIAIVDAGGMKDRVLYSGFDLNTLLEVENLRPEADTAYSINSRALAEEVIASPEAYNVDIAGINHKYLTAELVRDMHLAGKEVYAWTVNSKVRIAECVAMGVDGILTNYPDYM